MSRLAQQLRIRLLYESEMKLEEPFMLALEFVAQFPEVLTQPQITPPAVAKLAYVESTARTDVVRVEYEIRGVPNPNTVVGGVQAQLLTRQQGWVTE